MSEEYTATREGSVRVVGTAHVSSDSVEEVERVIEDEQPDTVAVELDEGRFRQMKGDAPEDLDPGDLLKGNMAVQFLAYWLLSYVQKRLGDKFGIEPGADMKAGIDSAEQVGADVALVDRDIQMTIQRFWARMKSTEKLRLVGDLALGVTDRFTLGLSVGGTIGLFTGVLLELFGGPYVLPTGGAVPIDFGILAGLVTLLSITVEVIAFALIGGFIAGVLFLFLFPYRDPDEIEEFSMDELTDSDVVSAMMEEFRRFSPEGANALIDERDAFIAHNLVGLREQGKHVVAIVGAGHREGIEQYLANPDDLPPMESLIGVEKKRFSLFKVIGFLFTVAYFVFFGLLLMAGVNNMMLLKIFAVFFVLHAILATALARLAGAHWTSAGVGGAVAWMTTLHPLLAPGWFSGYVELRYLDVNISDISTLNELLDDEETPLRIIFDRMLDVPLFRLILIVALTNIGSILGTVLFWVVISFVGGPFDSTGALADALVQGVENSIETILQLL